MGQLAGKDEFYLVCAVLAVCVLVILAATFWPSSRREPEPEPDAEQVPAGGVRFYDPVQLSRNYPP